MRRIPSFVYGHVIGALITGLVGGAFLDLTAVLVFGAGLAAAAVVGALVCWWRPKFDASAWKLWLVAIVANPLFIAGLVWTVIMRDCLTGELKGWSCLFAEVGLVAAAATLPSPVVGLIVRWYWARWRPSR
ncbi:MAG: hypothetical protein J0J01_01835 [Reyranella sp.]|uniref:hypothetical protein n=1 Tax=Reyranella sp. TaxID=1929291 RepID=UPI001AC7EE79|nr:hypothetical protein [Reyranella sp.]MBN9085623.1 hypothetical protein [Reyranella sp.]